ncbi:MAG: prohibitin family protein [Chloroflexi bacterium]|jgi:regulator of protease activity HflC (stomatin/prohibitin superfamily)|nr:prohibitin family protein [Chloroflexota bacterium]
MAKRVQSRSFQAVGIVLLIVVAVLIVLSSYTIIGPGQRGVVVFLGNVETANPLGEGFHLVIPPVARQVVPVDVRTRKLELTVDAASRDMQQMTVTGVLNYHLNPQEVGLLYQHVGLDYENIIVVPALHEAIKAATAVYRVEDVLSQRAILKQSIQDALTQRLAETYITVDEFSFANVQFSDEYNQAIERKQVAEQAARQKEYELQAAQKDIEIAVARAEADKEAAIKAAEGRAQARQLEAEAEAAALALIAAQLRNNPALIQYQWASNLAPGVSTVLLPSDQGIILDASTLVK